MNKIIRVLIVEDSTDDAELLVIHLQQAGYRLEWERIESLKEMQQALRNKVWDIVISDYSMPDFNGLHALKLSHEFDPNLPFILLSGTIGEDIAVNALKSGAHDYIMKDNLTRLIPAIKRELADAELRKAKNEAVEALRESEKQYRLLAENTLDVIWTMDLELNFTYVNPAVKILTGYTPEEWIGNNLTNYCDQINFNMMADIFKAELEKGKSESGTILNSELIKKNGDTVSVEILGTVIYNENGEPVELQGVTRDITERKIAEEKIKKNLREKEVLLRELYHRTNNNMQLISSILRIQSRRMKDKSKQTIFQEIENKINSMALVHKKLFESKDLSHLNLKDYFATLINLLKKSFDFPDKTIESYVRGVDVYVLIDIAIPLGLVLNELYTNSMKYAFANRKHGKIEIKLDQTDQGDLQIIFADDGVGLPEGFDLALNSNLGLDTIFDLVEKQLHGKFKIINENGLIYQLTFAENLYQPRV
ncbi:MAG: PAS domain S-box protein [Candidatus Cloacimonetes bacterium]|nr:PAS domain S-box protein [Candidatus Cloacimonadota bacterium]